MSGKDDHGVFLLNQRTGETARLDEAMFFVWVLCDGTRSLEQMAQELAAQTGDPYDEMLQLVHHMLSSLENLGLVQRAG